MSDDRYEDDFHSDGEESGPAGAASKKDKGWQDVAIDEIELDSKPLSGGGFALVYRGRWRGRYVAVKTLFDPKIDERQKQEYMDELHVMRELRHPNIVEFLGACVTPPKLCFIMELCKSSLYRLLHETRTHVSEQELVNYGIQVTDALHYLHSRRPMLIHRDIKSHNLLISDDNQIKLCDFGLVSTRVTTAGTPNYMAPELLEDRPFSKAVDVYAFGMVLWEMFARQVPYAGWRPADIRDEVLAGGRPAIPKYDWPEEIVRLIKECWAADAAKRPSIEEVGDRLRAWRPHVSAVSALSGGFGGDALDALLKK